MIIFFGYRDKVKRPLMILLCSFITLLSVSSQELADSVVSRMQRQLTVFPQEKVSMHVDRTVFLPGDSVCMKVYVTDAATLVPALKSQFVYVELLDSKRQSLQRKRLIASNNLFTGHIDLPHDQEAGIYYLWAYTLYSAQLKDYDCLIPIQVGSEKPESNGKRNASKNVIPLLRFFPEGGYLVEGSVCMVGFEAVSNEGDSLSISGEIVDKAGKVVSHFSTSHHGLGRFPLSVKAGEQYAAICKNVSGHTYSFPLPQSRNDVACLQCRQRSDDIQVIVNSGNDFHSRNLHLLVHCRGQIVSYQDIRPGSLYHLSPTSLPAGVNSVLLIDDEAHVLSERLLFSSNTDINMPLTIESSKQKYDIRDSIPLQLSLPGLKEGEFAFLSLSVTDDGITRGSHSPSLWSQLLLSSDIQGYIPQADDYFSPVWQTDKLDLLMMVNGWRRYDMPAVLQGNYTFPSVEHEHSQSVRGRIRAVFKNQPIDSVQVSLAIMKQRYVNGTFTDAEGRFEFDNLNFSEDADAYVYAKRKKDRRCLVEIDQQRPPFTPDILKKKGSVKWIPWLNIDDDLLQSYSQDSHLLEEVVVKGQAPTYLVDQPNMSFDRNSIKEGNYADFAMLLLCTNCLYIDNENELIKLDPAYATSIERLSMAGSSNNALDTMTDAATDSASGGPYASWPTIRLYVNGSEVPNASLHDISLTDVERVDLYLGNRAWIFGVTEGGVVDITIRGGLHRASDNIFNNKIVRLEGYQAPAEYYFPRYPKGSRPSEMLPDVRRTLYWNPYLRMIKDMPMHLDFYSADIPTTYTVRVEGVTSHGRIVSGTLPLTIKINN